MRKIIVAVVAAGCLFGGASAAVAGPEKIIEWLKNPCVPTGDLEDGCQLPL